MLRPAKTLHPPEPLLVPALKASLREIAEEHPGVLAIMHKVKRRHPDYPEGGMIELNGDGRLRPYFRPETIEEADLLVREVGEELIGDLEKAPTIEAQEELLLEYMRAMVDSAILLGSHPQASRVVIGTIEDIFRQIILMGERRSQPLVSMQQTVEYYGRIANDSLECSRALMHEIQAHEPPGEDGTKRAMGTPYALAWKRHMQAHPTKKIPRSVPSSTSSSASKPRTS